jgi:hypothetical protein
MSFCSAATAASNNALLEPETVSDTETPLPVAVLNRLSSGELLDMGTTRWEQIGIFSGVTSARPLTDADLERLNTTRGEQVENYSKQAVKCMSINDLALVGTNQMEQAHLAANARERMLAPSANPEIRGDTIDGTDTDGTQHERPLPILPGAKRARFEYGAVMVMHEGKLKHWMDPEVPDDTPLVTVHLQPDSEANPAEVSNASDSRGSTQPDIREESQPPL